MHKLLPLLLLLVPTFAIAQKDLKMNHARGTFTVDMKPVTQTPAQGIACFTIDKHIHGDLEAMTKGQMMSAGDFKKGNAGYVAMEVVTGTLAGKHGSFALQHFATMDQSGPKMNVLIVPGSGTGDLQGITGTFQIKIDKGVHSYDLAYELP